MYPVVEGVTLSYRKKKKEKKKQTMAKQGLNCLFPDCVTRLFVLYVFLGISPTMVNLNLRIGLKLLLRVPLHICFRFRKKSD